MKIGKSLIGFGVLMSDAVAQYGASRGAEAWRYGGPFRPAGSLGLRHADAKLGGLETTVIVEDDELKPDAAVGKARQLIERDKVDFVVGPVFSNILMAIYKPITEVDIYLKAPMRVPRH
jgi:branched-chain amino acid transport system substrate-binding protein